jgi:hypothetical protein
MERRNLFVVLWMIVSFAIGTVAFSLLDGAVLSFLTTFGFWAVLRIREIYE